MGEVVHFDALLVMRPRPTPPCLDRVHRRMLRLSMITAGTNPDETNPFFYILEPVIDRERDE